MSLIRVFWMLPVLVIAGCALPGMKLEKNPDSDKVDAYMIPISSEIVSKTAPGFVPPPGMLPVTELAGDAVPTGQYRVGPMDTLDITVWGHPDLNNPGGMTQTAESRGRQVRADGTIFYPYVGVLSVAGKSVDQIRVELTRKLGRYLKNPQVDVRVGIFKAEKFYVTGEVESPGTQYRSNESSTLMDAINRAGGMTENADLRTAYLTRDGRKYAVNLLSLYSSGDASQNINLKAGDTLHINDNRENSVFMVGELSNQIRVPMHKGRLTLAEALSESEGLDLNTADPAGIYVIRRAKRGTPLAAKPVSAPSGGEYQNDLAKLQEMLDGEVASTTGTAPSVRSTGPLPVNIYQLNAKSPEALILADAFELAPRDIVYVSTAGMVRWNRVLSQIMPTLQAILITDRLADRN